MKHTFLPVFTLVVVLFMSNAYALDAASDYEIKISAGGTPVDVVLTPIKNDFEKKENIRINNLFGNAVLSFEQLKNNESEAAMAGSSFEDLMVLLKKNNIEVKDQSQYKSTTVAKSKFYVVVNKDNPITKLSKEQIKGIFTGKIENWKEVGGKDSVIIVALSTINPATNSFFQKTMLDSEPFIKEFLETKKFEDMANDISLVPESIGFGPSSVKSKNVKTVEIPEISRPVILITKGEPSEKIQKLIKYISNDGQNLLKE